MSETKLKIWFLAARPKTLPAAIAPVIIGAALACPDVHFNVPILALTFLAAVLIQIGTNLANDYYDFVKGTDTADRTGPTRATQAGLVTPAEMKLAFIITFSLAAAVGLILTIYGGWPILIIGIASLICGIAYTAGPVPLGYVGLADFFVLIFFGPVAVGGTYYLQTDTIDKFVIIAGFAPGLISTAILTVNNIRDIDTDRIAGKRSLPVRFGRAFGIAEYILCIIVACLIPVYLWLAGAQSCFILLPTLTLLFAVWPCITILTKPSPEKLNDLLAATGRLLLIFAILFSIGATL